MSELTRGGEAPAGGGSTPVLEADVADQLERYRVELTGYCYRMMGSAEAEDAVQETLVRAWRAHDRFEGRSSLRSWLYRIATNVCLDMLGGVQRRARPMDLSSPVPASSPLGAPLPEATWVEPMPDSRTVPAESDPAEVAVARETVRLAFVAALQHLAPKQRVVLILREVLGWRAAEVAELLDTSVASVNSALQRARATLASGEIAEREGGEPLDEEHHALLGRYLAAFESYDMESLTSLLHEDATLSMPPFPLWLVGPTEISAWMLGKGHGCQGSRLVPVEANGMRGFGQYRPDPEGGHAAWALQVIEVRGDRISGINSFLDTARLFPLFGLPLRLDDETSEPVGPTPGTHGAD
ncbi:sigma-70 family RNA polymerase sigma factor [Streptomyces sp. NPDC005438]|uniref:sigma-70 family RNA polymerase sigma factor n=1 Tax=Streptomyces sp. NPDC005438 TaxID=3156880 RepID=UPI0033B55753